MTYKELMQWIENTRPIGMLDSEFRDFLVLIGATAVKRNLDITDETIDELIVRVLPNVVQ